MHRPCPSETDAPPLIHARGLTKRFGEFTAVDAIDFDVAPGESFGFLGPNGAGKTSTMRMVACVSPVTEGTLRILDLDPDADGPRIRGRLGVVPQQDTLDTELSVKDNLVIYGRYFGLSRAEASRRGDELLEFAQLTERANDKVEPLSGGMKRRLTIARVADQRAVDPAPRRADDGPRPAGAPPAVGAAVPAQAARRDAGADDPLHGRGRAAVRPARRHGQGDRSSPRARRAS